MSYRGSGGYRGDFRAVRRRRSAGDLTDVWDTGGSYDVPTDATDESSGLSMASFDPGYTTMDTGSSLALPGTDWGSIVQSIGGFAGGLGPSLGTGVVSAVKSILGGGSPAAAGAASSGGSASAAVKKAVQKALKVSGVRVGGRRMNPGNFKALRRSMRRLTAFEHAARRVIKFTHPRPGARVKWKFHRRKKR